MEKLKPCPFCGGEAYYRHPTKNKGHAFVTMMVECKKCGASPYAINVYEFENDEKKYAAIAREWNRRTPDTIKTAHCVVNDDGDIVCSECKQPFVMTGARYCPVCGSRLLDLIAVVAAPDGAKRVKIFTEEELHRSHEEFCKGAKSISISTPDPRN